MFEFMKKKTEKPDDSDAIKSEIAKSNKKLERITDSLTNIIARSEEPIDEKSEQIAVKATKMAEAIGKSDEELAAIYFACFFYEMGKKDVLFQLKDKTKVSQNIELLALCDMYDNIAHRLETEEVLSYNNVREEFVKESADLFDPVLYDAFLKILDHDFRKDEDIIKVEEELTCNKYKEMVSSGIRIDEEVKTILFESTPIDSGDTRFAKPSIVIFDADDKCFHSHAKTISTYRYVEYGELFFDGNFVYTAARNMEVRLNNKVKNANGKSDAVSGSSEGDSIVSKYKITTSAYGDHVSIEVESDEGVIDCVVALPSGGKACIGITGENCHISNIVVDKTGNKVGEGDIRIIADKINYIERMESDLPNVQIEGEMSSYTEGVKLSGELRLKFHTMTIPGSEFVWNCPFIVFYNSDNGEALGENYIEFDEVKLNGESVAGDEIVESKLNMEKTDEFEGWDVWKEKNKEGIECEVVIHRRGNKIVTSTENLGIKIENTTVLNNHIKDVYVALTGSHVALTDIRAVRRWL